MQQLQISRGKLNIRLENKELLPGELFLDYTHGVKYDEENKTYELYAGCNGENIKIGGQGVLSFIREIESLPSDPIQGGIYYVTKDINLKSNSSSTGQDIPEFREGDLAIYVGEELVHYANPLNHDVHGTNFRGNGTFPDLENARGWIRVNNGGGAAYEVTFDPTNTNFNKNTKTVQEALVELDRNKLAYGGIKFELNTTDENVIDPNGLTDNTITVENLFNYVKPGYYYSVGTLLHNTNIKVQLSEDNSITLEEGDFLAVTSNVTSNDSPIEAKDLKFEKIAGGTHDSAKVNYKAGDRNETLGNSSDAETWTESDGNIKNVAEALDQLFYSKADLNNKGKIPLTQLPDTLINSMEYVGTYTFNGEDKDPENFTLPTAADKIAHSDEATSGDEGTKLVQGDYFIYTGKQINIKNITDSAVKNNIESADGFINSGDWLVYNGEGNKWSVIDNTSPIQSIRVIDNYSENGDDTINQDTIKTVIGEVQFRGSTRVVDENDSSKNISETQLEADNKETVTIHNKNSALISDDNQASLGYFYKENGNKTLIKTGISENNDTLKIEEANGLLLTGATGVEGTVHIVQNDQPEEQDLEIKLPNHSGTLATLDDTGIVDGQDFYIPMYRMGEDEKITLENSPIELIEHSGNDYDLKGFKFHSGINSTGTNGSDHNVIFKTVDGDNELVHIMPGTSGYILNSNSIIDCGEWTDDGLKFEHQGDCDTIAGILDGNTKLGKTTGTPYKDALKSTIFDGITEQEIIDAYITNA